MAATILLSNPFLLDAGARGRMLATMAEKSGEMAAGYGGADPHQIYRTGWEVWYSLPVFIPFYGAAFRLLVPPRWGRDGRWERIWRRVVPGGVYAVCPAQLGSHLWRPLG